MRSSRQCRVMASSVETAAQRYARAAAKYRTGPPSNTIYTPPKLLFNTDVEDLNLKEQVSLGQGSWLWRWECGCMACFESVSRTLSVW
jgi:hypothetical protein